MNIKPLAVAIAMALVSITAEAVNTSRSGLGQVMLIPYYTVQGNNATLISITNATDQVKAISVRFREAQNSSQVLQFHLYLSPYDVWTGKITNSNLAEGGTKIITGDTSCTVPTIPAEGMLFYNDIYAGKGLFVGDAGDHGMGRTSEGYIEVIEMGVVTAGSNPARAAAHTWSGSPVNCQYLIDSWSSSPLGRWITDASLDVTRPTGGLFAEANILNVQAGVEFSEQVTVLENFFLGPTNLHSAPGTGLPTLANAEPKESKIILSGSNEVLVDEWNSGIDAVSATLMASAIMNGYSVNPSVGSSTEWIVNFPTKHFYTYPVPAQEPFTNNFTASNYGQGTPPGSGAAWEAATSKYWDRESLSPSNIVVDSFSPKGSDIYPRLSPALPWALPYAVNIISFNTPYHNSDFIASQWAKVDFNVYDPLVYTFKNGWARISFEPAFDSTGRQVTSNRELVSRHGTTFIGLPVMGFMATVLTNNNVGVGAAYASTAEHRYIYTIIK